MKINANTFIEAEKDRLLKKGELAVIDAEITEYQLKYGKEWSQRYVEDQHKKVREELSKK